MTLAVDALPWFAVQCLAGQETVAALNLRHRQHRWVFVSMVRVRQPGREPVHRHRFPGYIFVQLDLSLPGWQRVNKAVGVYKLLPVYLDRPLPLPHGFVERLMSQPDDAAVLVEFGEHAVVRIICGPLEGLVAEVERQDGERLRARLDNGTAIDNLPVANVERA